ncbi:MAG TPA: hypothetical protein VI451_03745 [Anaerolineales bacterium]|nr:hypothetical protein [Anaerolineales bacterium]
MSDDRTLTRKQIVQTIEKWENTDRQGHFAVVLGETVGYIGCYGFRPLHSAVMGIAAARKY